MTEPATAKRRLKIGALVVVGLFLGVVALFVFYPEPSLETISSDGRLSCYVKYSSIVLASFADASLRVADLKTGETVDVKSVEGGVFREGPIDLVWSEDGRHFAYFYEEEPGSFISAFDVKTAPLKVEESAKEKARVWVPVLLKQQLKSASASAEAKKRAQKYLDYPPMYWE